MNKLICPCIFIKKRETGFAIIAMYVDDLNLIGTPKKLIKTSKYLENEYEMKYLGKAKFYLGLQIEYFLTVVLVHQSTYTKKILKRFFMDKAHLISSLGVVNSLDVKDDPFRHSDKGEEWFGSKVPYLSVISALMYLTNCTRQILFFLSIYYPYTVMLKPEDIGIISNICCATYKEQLI